MSAAGGQAPHFPTHVRRGSEGWVVQDLTVQQRVQLYDQQQQYRREFGPPSAKEGGEEEEDDYQEGLSDIEGDAFGRLPHQRFSQQESSEEEEESSEEYDEIPYDVASDEYDNDDEYDEYEDYNGDDDDFDEHNPYLAYDDDEEEEEYSEEGDQEEEGQDAFEVDDDEVALHGRDRHKIGRFFDQVKVEDEWDEGEGLDVGCRPAVPAGYMPGQKTLYQQIAERQQAMKTPGEEVAKTKKKSKKKKNKTKDTPSLAT